MGWHPDKQTMARALLLGLVLVSLSLLGACSEPAVDTAEAASVPAPATCAGQEVDSSWPAGVAAAAGRNESATDPIATARWYLDGRLTVDDLARFYTRINYHLSSVSAGAAPVPRLLMARMPSDLRQVGDIARRKAMFIATVLPMALQVNEVILRQRQAVIALADCVRNGGVPSTGRRQRVSELHARYETNGDTDRLLRRLDAVPPSLILAQAAIESHWGMSRFARHGNALFGERTYRQADGLVPSAIGGDVSFRVRRFDTLLESIETYVFNLNVSYAYEDFRRWRSESRREGDALDGFRLAGGLGAYSERGADYIADLRAIISTNGLDALDRAELERVEHLAIQEPVYLWGAPSKPADT